MSPENIYLTCFVTGFLLSLLSIVLHSLDFHLPGSEVGDIHVPHAGGPAHAHATDHHGFSFFNFMTVSAFLAWFGGTGYLLERYAGFGLILALILAVLTGLAGASIVYLIVTRVLLRNEKNLDPADFDMIGVLGHVSSAVRENGGTGEMIYSSPDARRSSPIRSEDGQSAIPRNTEVVVTRYENGIAYVRRWDELSGMEE